MTYHDKEHQDEIEFRHMLHAAGARILSDYCDTHVLEKCTAGHWPQALWDALQKSGLTDAVKPDSTGNELLDWETLSVLISLAGEFAAPIPWVETLLAQRHFTFAGLAFPDGPLSISNNIPGVALPTLTSTKSGWRVNGRISRIGWGHRAAAIAVPVQYQQGTALVRLEPAILSADSISPSFNVADEPKDAITLSSVNVSSDCVSLSYKPVNNLLAEGSLARSLQMVAAMRKVLDLTLQYSKDRVQFGRPIAKFQAIQHLVAVQASHTAAASAAALAATFAAKQGPAMFEIAAAKVRTGEAAGLAARTAHQVHGAMGITKEYSLHFWTRRLFAWRDEFGNEAQWADALGKIALHAGGVGLWPLICDPSPTASRLTALMEGLST
ncbi:acyl-CoA dehydrogenase family protein [Orrella marina]|uniref:Acyl-CoA dehydrogenase/oxidase C-terminal domain-containing protein n=1 Tax=Orrella marina TaxID=2163011 RepID=A0A2R4XFZ3_9BURK|nr:acyl-CoA dehydrogenase family protein [Orrella marina]AWB32730.1 hypothetical protein DBV39_02250 [Orrella marina]